MAENYLVSKFDEAGKLVFLDPKLNGTERWQFATEVKVLPVVPRSRILTLSLTTALRTLTPVEVTAEGVVRPIGPEMNLSQFYERELR